MVRQVLKCHHRVMTTGDIETPETYRQTASFFIIKFQIYGEEMTRKGVLHEYPSSTINRVPAVGNHARCDSLAIGHRDAGSCHASSHDAARFAQCIAYR